MLTRKSKKSKKSSKHRKIKYVLYTNPPKEKQNWVRPQEVFTCWTDFTLRWFWVFKSKRDADKIKDEFKKLNKKTHPKFTLTLKLVTDKLPLDIHHEMIMFKAIKNDLD